VRGVGEQVAMTESRAAGPRLPVTALAVVVVVVGIAIAWVAITRVTGSSAAPAVPQQPQPSGAAVQPGKEAAALATASAQVGFAVEAVGQLPDPQLHLFGVIVDPGPLPEVTLSYARTADASQATIRVIEQNQRAAHPANYTGTASDPNHRVDIGNPKAEVWSYDAWPNYGVYTVFIGQRTYFIEVHSGRLTTPQLKAMIAPWLE